MDCQGDVDESTSVSSGSLSLDLRDMWRYGFWAGSQGIDNEEVSEESTKGLRKVWEGPAGKGCGPFFGMSWKGARRPAAGTFQVRDTAVLLPHSSLRRSRRSTGRWWSLSATLSQIQRTASLSRVRMRSTIWRTSCCALLRILLAVLSCKPSCTNRRRLRWLQHVIFRWTCCSSVRTERWPLSAVDSTLLQHFFFGRYLSPRGRRRL